MKSGQIHHCVGVIIPPTYILQSCQELLMMCSTDWLAAGVWIDHPFTVLFEKQLQIFEG